MKKAAILPCLLFASAFALSGAGWAQPAADDTLHVIKSSVNADSDNAELCLEFDKPLFDKGAASTPSARLLASLHLTQNGKNIVPQNIVPTAASLCLFPLDRGQPYQMSLNGLRPVSEHGTGSAQGEKMAAPYNLSFTIPDRSPLLAFTGINGGINGFGAYDGSLNLRAINVPRAKIDVYRITDIPTMARIWQDRAQTILAPSESAYLARDKGQLAWSGEMTFDGAPNSTIEQKISLHDKLPDLAPGLYLIIADAGGGADTDKPASKGLAPLAATWFTRSDFSIQAIRDSDGTHVIASSPVTVKDDIHFVALNRQSEQVADAHGSADGLTLVPTNADATMIIGVDAAGNAAFADITSLPPLESPRTPGMIASEDPITPPADSVTLTTSLPAGIDASEATPSFVRLMQGHDFYADFSVPAQANSALSFPAPVLQGPWNIHWQKNDGAVLAASPLRITANPDAPYLIMTSDTDMLGGQSVPDITINALTSSGKPLSLASGRLMMVWQSRNPLSSDWKEYHFGVQAELATTPTPIADFLTDEHGSASLHPSVPKSPSEPGLYQAAFTTLAEPDQGAADAPTLTLPLKPDGVVIGIKPLSPNARFFQNSLARFALIGLSADDRPRDVPGLSYQIYEEGRSFDWYQDDGRWNYKREPQLRPIGGGPITVKADGSSIVEWPVTAGNYRLEIFDAAGKIIAQSNFSAGWDSVNAAAPSLPLAVTLPKVLAIGRETSVHFTLASPALVTAVVSDTHIRKMIHEMRPKGDNVITFIPAADWQNGVNVSIEATGTGPDGSPVIAQALAQAALSPGSDAAPLNTAPLNTATGATLIAATPPAALVLHDGESATLTFGVENRGNMVETYHYTVSASPGLKTENDRQNSFTLGGRQSRTLPIVVTGETIGAKEIKLDVVGTHTARVTRTWPMAVVSENDFLRSTETATIQPQQALITMGTKTHDGAIAFVAKRSMQGLPEILTYLFNARPFTTQELAASIDALRLWDGALAQAGLAPDFTITARSQMWLKQLLRHQNSDGGFARARGEDSTMEDTAAALIALGPDSSELVHPAKNLAIGWLKQKLSNTWFDEKERTPRAAAYAGLAAADAIDPASLRYFSDISATMPMTAEAEANMAAAFKHVRDPNAAAFWIKKMIDEHGQGTTIPLLNALAATDALSSDDVHAAMEKMAAAINAGVAPALDDAAKLLRALAADNVNSGKWRLATGNQTHEMTGVYAVRLSDAGAGTLRNGDAQPLSVTVATEGQTPRFSLPTGAEMVRHIYRLNGVELSPQAKPTHGEAYLVELSGKGPADSDAQQILLQDNAGSALRPIGCVLSPHLDVSSFMSWFSPHDLSPIAGCEMSGYGLDIVLAPVDDTDTNGENFKAAYFAHIDAKSVAALPSPQLRAIK